jgi:hypothetical protein
MAKQSINRGSTANDGTGDNIRAGAGKVNDNFDEIYTAIGDGTTLNSGNFLTDVSSNTVQNKVISGSANTLSNIPNSALTHDNISLGGVSIQLGTTDATPALDLTDATNYPSASLSGTVANTQLANSTLGLIDKSATSSSIALGADLTLTGGTAVDTAVAGSTYTISVNGITNGQLANNSIQFADTSSSTSDIALGGSMQFLGGSGITTVVSGSDMTITASGLANSNLSGSAGITNANIANPNITIGADTINLGATQTTITDLNLDGTSSLSGTGNIDQTGAGSKVRGNFASAATLPAHATYSGMFVLQEDTTPPTPKVASAGSYIELLTENSSVSKHQDVNISGVADGNILVWNSVQARFNAGDTALGLAQTWRITTSTTSTGNSSYADATAWEHADDALYSSKGTLLTQSSGIFTLPSTGLYLVTVNFQWTGANGDFVRVAFSATDNNSTYTQFAVSEDSVSAGGYGNNNLTYIFNCQDTANEKFKLEHSGSGSSQFSGNTTMNRSHFTILKIG